MAKQQGSRRPRAAGSARPGSDGRQPSRAGAPRAGRPNRALIYTVAALVVGLAIVAFAAVTQLSPQPVDNRAIVTPGHLTPASIPVDGQTLGRADAKVTIDLYGDFRCSACYQFVVAGVGDRINTNLVATGKARLVWHDFLTIDHMQTNTVSRDAANAARCAADQGKFWTMHDWLYANQTSEAPSVFTQDRLLKIGQAAGMDMTTFTTCVQNGTHNAEIAAAQATVPASVAQVGTPSVLVNGVFVEAAYDKIEAAVNAALAPAASPAASGSG